MDSPIVRLALAGVAAVLLLVFLTRRRGSSSGKPAKSSVDREIEKLVEKGRLPEAARLAIEHGKLGQGLELYLRAQQPANAASVAVKMNDHRQAAELYERAGNLERAAHYFEQAGNQPKAEELRAKLDGGRTRRSSNRPDAAPEGARSLEAAWRQKVALSDGSDVARADLQRGAREAADALLAEGEIRRAADLYRDAELDDEAIHLYVNVLGEPGQAAPIVARKGNHQRAAELYELAGERERAAMAWVSVARESPRPDPYLERIEDLSPAVAVSYLEREVATLRLSADNAALYYFLARGLALTGQADRARDSFRNLQAIVGAYRDVEDRIARLSVPAAPEAPAAPAPAPAPAPAAPRLSAEELQELAGQVARAAAEQLKRQGDLASIMSAPAVSARSGKVAAAPAAQIAGLEVAPLHVELLHDDAVAGARVGPGIDTLKRFIKGPCDLQNIEVYFRVGMAHLAAGDYEQALEAFDAVEDASPGYRDAWKRADEIRGWKQALGKRGTKLGAADGGGGESRYQLRGELGRGGMAVVYRAFDEMLGREVALKFLAEELSSQTDMKEMFQREARAVASLNHPNIVTIHDVGFLEGRAFICMEFVDGRSVESLILEAPGLTIVESLRVTKQALDALAYAHHRSIIHRDIKPANMMRTQAGLVKLMDFGLAKSMSDRRKTSYIAGTPGYMAPEHLRGEELDARADLFAIAVSLYEMLSGELPYAGMERNQAPVPLDERVPAVPPSLAEAVMKGLALDRRDRWASAEEMLQPIAQILEAVARFAGSSAPPTRPAAPVDPAKAATVVLGGGTKQPAPSADKTAVLSTKPRS